MSLSKSKLITTFNITPLSDHDTVLKAHVILSCEDMVSLFENNGKFAFGYPVMRL